MTTAFPRELSWPEQVPDDRPLLLLLDVSSNFEAQILTGWVERRAPGGSNIEYYRIAPSRRRRRRWRTDPGLGPRLRRGDDPWLIPLRVAWLPNERRGRRVVSAIDLLKLGDPRDPDALRQRVIHARRPDRVTVIVGEGAAASRLVADHARAVEVQDLSQFVARRAWRTLDRAERAIRGNRYKVPKFLHEEIFARPAFQQGAIDSGAARGLGPDTAVARARHYLREMAASHSPFLIDLIATGIHWLYRQGYGNLRYDQAQVGSITTLGQEYPLAFLPSHRSNLDRLSFQYLLWENDLPPNHTAGGINMNFFPVGPLLRRTGVFFIRRSFQNNQLYKFVLRTYLDYLVENRFPLEWYLEGGRSRTGKLLPPRFGLLAYVVDSYLRGTSGDLILVPVSIVYDQIQDLSSYTAEAQGAAKEKESLAWMMAAIRSLRRRYGDIHVRFGEPISVAKELEGIDAAGEGSIDLAKLGFEVMHRIGRATAITPAAIVSIALLEVKGAGRTLLELTKTCAELCSYVATRRLPTTVPLNLQRPQQVKLVLDLLAEHGNVSSSSQPEPVYWLEPEQMLRASYYRNVVVHYFVTRGIVEIASIGAGEQEDPVEYFWDQVARLRDLLKFEFFFAGKGQFVKEIEADLTQDLPGWERLLASGEMIDHLRPLVAHWAVLPFLESYLVMADELAATEDSFEEKVFLRACLQRGESYRRRELISSGEAVSQVMFKQALALAVNRGLTEAPPRQRQDLASEIWSVIDRARSIGLRRSRSSSSPGQRHP